MNPSKYISYIVAALAHVRYHVSMVAALVKRFLTQLGNVYEFANNVCQGIFDLSMFVEPDTLIRLTTEWERIVSGVGGLRIELRSAVGDVTQAVLAGYRIAGEALPVIRLADKNTELLELIVAMAVPIVFLAVVRYMPRHVWDQVLIFWVVLVLVQATRFFF